jgi:hypothetical protein
MTDHFRFWHFSNFSFSVNVSFAPFTEAANDKRPRLRWANFSSGPVDLDR